jgi:hypothetical protein
MSLKYSRVRTSLIVALLLCVSAGAMIMINSVHFSPDPSGDVDFIAHAQQKSAAGMRVSASALGARESRRSFGEDLAKYGIQPVWLSIENETDDQLVYLPIAMDPEYYSPYEVSYRFHRAFSPAANHARDIFFLQRQISGILPPHSRTTGFVYGVVDAGVVFLSNQAKPLTEIERLSWEIPPAPSEEAR